MINYSYGSILIRTETDRDAMLQRHIQYYNNDATNTHIGHILCLLVKGEEDTSSVVQPNASYWNVSSAFNPTLSESGGGGRRGLVVVGLFCDIVVVHVPL